MSQQQATDPTGSSAQHTVLNLDSSLQMIYDQSQKVDTLQKQIGSGENMDVSALLQMQFAASILTQQLDSTSQLISLYGQSAQQSISKMTR